MTPDFYEEMGKFFEDLYAEKDAARPKTWFARLVARAKGFHLKNPIKAFYMRLRRYYGDA